MWIQCPFSSSFMLGWDHWLSKQSIGFLVKLDVRTHRNESLCSHIRCCPVLRRLWLCCRRTGNDQRTGISPFTSFPKKTCAVQATKQCKICSRFQRIVIIGFYIINLNTKSMTPFPVMDNPTGDFYRSDQVLRFDYERRQFNGPAELSKPPWSCSSSTDGQLLA